jgi:hypothetical protein
VGELCERLTTFDIRDEKDGPLFSPVFFHEGKTTRANKHIRGVWGLLADCDESHTVDQICALIPDGVGAIIHSTHRHGIPEKDGAAAPGERYRVFFLLEKEVGADEYPDVWERLNLLFDGEIDSACKDISRGFFLPSHPTGEGTVAKVIEGRCLRLDDLPPLPADFNEPKFASDFSSHGPGSGRPGADFNARATNEDVAAILENAGAKVFHSTSNVWRIKRPGKTGPGISGTLGFYGPGVFHCFSSNFPPFEAGHAYKPFSSFGLLEHGGDFKAAARALATRGYGDPPVKAKVSGKAGSPAGTDSSANDNNESEPPTFKFSTDRDLDACLSDISWLWLGYIPNGFPTMVISEQDMGKSTVVQDIARTLISGGRWPDGQELEPLPQDQKILWIDTEGTLALFRQRLIDWGMPRGRFIFPEDPLKELLLDNPRDWQWIEAAIERFSPPLIVVDALSGSHQGEENSNDNMKLILKRMAELTQRRKIACVIIHHLNKAPFGVPEYPITLGRVRGAGAITQFCRSVLALGIPDKNNPESRRMDVIKMNLAKKPKPIGYALTNSGPVWGDAPEVPQPRRAADDAHDFLLDILANGLVLADDVRAEARAKSIGENSLKAAKRALKVKSHREGGKDGRWFWALPHYDVGKEAI